MRGVVHVLVVVLITLWFFDNSDERRLEYNRQLGCQPTGATRAHGTRWLIAYDCPEEALMKIFYPSRAAFMQEAK